MNPSYYQRKQYALGGHGVARRDDAHLPQWNASDKWHRHNYNPDANVNNAAAPVAPMPAATGPFGLAVIPLWPRVAERAPDSSKRVISRMDQLGTVIRGYNGWC